MSRFRPRARLALFLPLVMIACGKPAERQESLDSLDNELTDANSAGNTRDPALATALHDQIMVDPALAQHANANAIRPPSRPDTGGVPPDIAGPAPAPAIAGGKPAPAAAGDCPDCGAKRGTLTLGALAERQRNPGTAACASHIGYSAGWANRLPKGLALYPDARVGEAAGSDINGCALRIVSFASGAPMQRIIDWYYAQSTAAGYSAEHRADDGQHVLGGTRAGGAAYVIYFSDRNGGGTDVDLVVNGG